MMQWKKMLLPAVLVLATLSGCGKSDAVGSSDNDATASSYQLPESSPYVIYLPSQTDAEPATVPEMTEPVVVPETTEPVVVPDVTEPPTVPEVTDPVVSEPATVPDVNVPTGEMHVIVLDPGHGGGDDGSVYNGLHEKELTLAVGLYLRDYLMNNYSNVNVIMTRTDDTRLGENAKDDLHHRCDLAATQGAEYLISLHFNAEGITHEMSGSLICATRQPGLKEASEGLGNMVMDQLAAIGIPRGEVHFRPSDVFFDAAGNPMDYYAINRYCAEYGIPSIIIEHLFIDNVHDAALADSPEDLQALAIADGKAIAAYFGLQAK